MYICSFCKKPSEPGETQHKVVVATRIHKHPERDHAYPGRKNEKGEKVARRDPGGNGTQIVKEVNACAGCRFQHNTAAPDTVGGLIRAALADGADDAGGYRG